MFNELAEKKSCEFQNLKEKIKPDNLIYKFKIEGRILKGFSNYQNPIHLFINLRDYNINPIKVLKKQHDFKSDLGEIKKENLKSKLENQISVTIIFLI